TFGAVVAHWMQFADANANLLILAGMVGFLTGITRSPFTSAILVLEMTDRHSVIFHLMLASMVSNLTAWTIDRKSLYDHLKTDYLKEANTVSAHSANSGGPPRSAV
ncbi:MAG TPA: chloride channel protein, partial [Phnomibacter sp.]|nr:chloride channel protein [Phnomibacter sp.]